MTGSLLITRRATVLSSEEISRSRYDPNYELDLLTGTFAHGIIPRKCDVTQNVRKGITTVENVSLRTSEFRDVTHICNNKPMHNTLWYR